MESKGLDLIPELEFTKSKFQADKCSDFKTEKDLVNKLITFSITKELDYSAYTYSNKILKRDKIYIFKFKATNRLK